jgi:SagB-type dehydrogenase family enzyme
MKQKTTFMPLLTSNHLSSAQYQKKSSINELDRNLIPYEKWKESWKRIYYKEYPRFNQQPLNLSNINLTKKSFISVLSNRLSQREYTSKKITFDELSALLYYSAGINNKRDQYNLPKRYFPSGGMRFPSEIYLLVNNKKVIGLNRCSYHYNVKRNCLEEMFSIKNYQKLIHSIQAQSWVRNSSLIICISAVFNRSRVKYGERGYRYCLIETGHIGQNFYLLSSALGLKCCSLGGFSDYKINEELELNGDSESVLYMFAIGK